MGTSTGTPLRVVLIEDSPILRDMLRELLDELDGVQVVADADDEAGALAELERHRADLAIVDLELRAGSGLGVLDRLHAEPARYGHPRAVGGEDRGDVGGGVALARSTAERVHGDDGGHVAESTASCTMLLVRPSHCRPPARTRVGNDAKEALG